MVEGSFWRILTYYFKSGSLRGLPQHCRWIKDCLSQTKPLKPNNTAIRSIRLPNQKLVLESPHLVHKPLRPQTHSSRHHSVPVRRRNRFALGRRRPQTANAAPSVCVLPWVRERGCSEGEAVDQTRDVHVERSVRDWPKSFPRSPVMPSIVVVLQPVNSKSHMCSRTLTLIYVALMLSQSFSTQVTHAVTARFFLEHIRDLPIHTMIVHQKMNGTLRLHIVWAMEFLANG